MCVLQLFNLAKGHFPCEVLGPRCAPVSLMSVWFCKRRKAHIHHRCKYSLLSRRWRGGTAPLCIRPRSDLVRVVNDAALISCLSGTSGGILPHLSLICSQYTYEGVYKYISPRCGVSHWGAALQSNSLLLIWRHLPPGPKAVTWRWDGVRRLPPAVTESRLHCPRGELCIKGLKH